MAFLEKFLSETLGLTKFPPYLSTFYWALFTFTFIHLVVSPIVSKRFFPTAFGAKGRLARNTWSIHVVSQIHVLVVVPAALWCISNEKPGRDQERAFGWDNNAGYVLAISAAYFVWDALDAMINFIDPGFVAHGIACCAIYTMSFKPFVAYYGTRCLLWETSTFFLNNHWFLDKTGRTGTTIQLVNGVGLVASFFLVRIVYGGSISIQFLFTLHEVRHEVPIAYVLVYGLGNVVLQGLNWFWFYKIISALRKRFNSSDETVKLIGQDQIPNGLPTHA
ncbi:hypothetical protein CVT24_011438 [Panaeolus cyanescens]|uniref:TLC domain-containing protein n=1 Tax=Panaeolus cyanescens TaxID=181874 RepID=A0A409VGE4_9AGAR|nr:hypothetical protein CVT24_011438 [Panaeolus cyanescens]